MSENGWAEYSRLVLKLKTWKEKIDEVASPSQIKELVDEVQELKAFRTKAVTVFTVVQFGMAFWAWATKFMN